MIILVPTDKYNMQEIDQIEEIVENMGTTTEKISDVFTVSSIITPNEVTSKFLMMLVKNISIFY